MKRIIMFAVIILAFAFTFGCAGMSHTQQKTLSGGAIGAAGGAVLGAVAGNPAIGAAVGGAAGAGVGYIIGEHDQGRHVLGN